jgi:hypothetical protein
MPDPLVILGAMAVAFAVAGLLLGLFAWRGRGAKKWLFDAGWVLGIGAGFFAGCLVLGIRPRWVPREDLDRLLLVVVPAVVAVELMAAWPAVPRLLVWLARLAVIGSVARVLLHGSSYITDLTGPGTSAWSPPLAWLIFGGLAALSGSVWYLMALLGRRAPGASVPLCLAVTSVGAALTVMFSGYASGGQVGLPLAAAIVGATVSALVLGGTTRGQAPLGLPIVALYSLLVIGRFFGELTLDHGALLFLAPLAGWLCELPVARSRLPAWARGVARVVLVGAVVALVVVRAQAKFAHDFQSPSGSASERSLEQDYLNFGR